MRRSCHTIALWMGRPVWRSQISVVSRWLVIPIAATSDARIPALDSASCATPIWVLQISVASCSTQPGRGKICRNSFWPTALMSPAWSKTMARLLVVPWSSARMNLDWVMTDYLRSGWG